MTVNGKMSLKELKYRQSAQSGWVTRYSKQPSELRARGGDDTVGDISQVEFEAVIELLNEIMMKFDGVHEEIRSFRRRLRRTGT